MHRHVGPAPMRFGSKGAAEYGEMYRFLLVLTILSATGLQGWQTLINNFAVDVVHLDGQQMGMIQSLREVPGFLSLLVVYLLLLVKEHRLAALSVLILGLGVASTGLLPSYFGLVVTTLIMSFGFHYYETVNQSLTLQYFSVAKSPIIFGKLRGIASAANIGVGLVILVLANWLDYGEMYMVLGGVILLGGMFCLCQDPADRSLPPQRKKMVFRRDYWLFYSLTFLGGARRQVFIAFGVFLLVKKFNFTVQEVTVLFIINNVINYFASPLIGKAINRFGERKVLSLEYAGLIGIFLTYAYTESRVVAAVMYVLDFVLFNFAIAIRSYFQKIGDPRDVAPTMAVGFTINHVAAVVIPAVGGALWMVDYRIPFIGGAVLSLVSLVLTQCIRTTEPADS
ncbi:MAG: MFS transporter [Deltaproteobacteria bacterium]|nr:MFS transporter [Deltaproteobacteria bacterium]